jgi:hypothetical protein
MLLKSGSGGGSGRDVIFRLVAQADPAAKQVMKQFGDELAKQQKTITSTATAEVKKRADESLKSAKKTAGDELKERAKSFQQEIREAQKRDKTIADNHFKTELRRIDDVKKAEQKQAEETERYKQRLRANSAQLEQREKIRIAREGQAEQLRMNRDLERNLTNQGRTDARNARRGNRVGQAWGGAIGGLGNVARGVAYTGLIGQENTQTILNTVAGVEGAGSLYKGGKALAGSLGTLATGGSATGGAAISAGLPIMGAAVAALAAWLPTLAGAVKSAAIAIKGSSATHKGDVGGAIGEGVASSSIYSMGFGLLSDEELGNATQTGAYANLERSKRALESQKGAAEARRMALAQQASLVGDLGNFQRGAASGDLTKSQGVLRGDASRLAEFQTKGGSIQEAYANVKASMEQVKQLSLDSARAQIEGSRDQLSNLRSAQQAAKGIADESLRAYQGDIAKAAKLDPEGQMKLREIDRKRKSGEGLTSEELGFAEQFSEFKDYSQSEQERRARDYGLSDIFAGSKSRAEDDAKSATRIAEEVAKAELTIKQQHEIIVRLEGPGFAEEILKGIDESLPERLQGIEDKLRKDIDDKIRQAQTQFANSKSPTR